MSAAVLLGQPDVPKMSPEQALTVTPGIRLVFNPSLNQEEDFIAILQFKLRVAI